MTSSLGQRRFVFLFEYSLFLERCGLRSVTRSLAHSPLKRPRPIIFTIPAESQVATGHLEWKIGHYSYLRPLSRQNAILRPDRLRQILLAERLQDIDLHSTRHRIERDHHECVGEGCFQIVGER